MNIKELSSNYDITPHTLRYYEKIGLLTPDYLANGYRQYSYEHIQILNTIRDLRSFDIPLPKIKEYLDNKSSKLTKQMLDFELNSIHEKITSLEKQKKFLEERIELILLAEQQPLLDVILSDNPKRQIILSKSTNIFGRDIYLELKKLHKQFEKILNSNNQNVFGAVLNVEEKQMIKQVFYCLDEERESAEEIEAGTYATIYYSGNYKERKKALQLLNNFLEEKQLEPKSVFYEFYLIDFHETNNENEYISKIECRV